MKIDTITSRILKQDGIFALSKIFSKKERTGNKKELSEAVSRLLTEETIYAVGTFAGYYINANSKLIKKGTIVSVKTAYAFIRPIGETTPENDVYVDVNDLKGAMYRDEVLYVKYCNNVVLKILKRGTTSMVGTLSKKSNGTLEFFPSNMNMSSLSFKVQNANNIEVLEKQKIEVSIQDYNKQIVNIERVLGNEGERYPEVLGVLMENGFFDSFPKIVREEAEIVETIPIEKGNREDYTQLLTVTIDGDDTKDFDDAISLFKKGKFYELYVHIADVTEYVKEGSKIDEEAFRRATSVYFPENVFPMLPEELSNGVCSINPNEIRYALTARMLIDNNGDVKDGDIVKSLIKSDYRLTYNEVQGVLDGDDELVEKYKDIYSTLIFMEKLSDIIQAKRKREGAVNFVTQESTFIFEKDKIVDVRPYKYKKSNEIIESFMVTANSFVAKTMFDKKLPFVYRVHDKPDADRLENGIEFAKIMDLNITKNDFPKSFNSEIQKLKDKQKAMIVSYVLLRSMAKAKYDTQNLGHYGLGLKDYCHFTSPIRRYPDLIIHRVIKENIDAGQNGIDSSRIKEISKMCSEAAKQSSERENASLKAEREIVDLYKCEFMEDKLGQTYNGIIVSVTKFGLFIEFYNGIEGLLRMDELPNDYYDINDYSLVGEKFTFKVGDKIKVTIAAVEKNMRRISLSCNLAKKYGKKGDARKRWWNEDSSR